MKRFGLFVAGVVMFLQIGLVSAGGHNAPAELSFIGMVLWEVEHFMIHMGLTWQALATMPTSMQFGLALLEDQATCASMSPVVGMLFSSAWSALLVFLATVSGFLWAILWSISILVQQDNQATPQVAT